MFRDIFYYNTPIYREILLEFLQFIEKYYVKRTLFILDVVLKLCWGVQHAFQRRSARLVLSPLKNGFIRRSEPCCKKRSGTPQHSTASKIGLSTPFLKPRWRLSESQRKMPNLSNSLRVISENEFSTGEPWNSSR